MTDWMPHGFCFLWQPFVLWASVICNLILALAYIAIPAFLLRVLQIIALPKVLRNAVIGFALFVLLCGLTHAMDIVVIWKPWYYVDVAVKGAAAAVSIAVAITLYSNRVALTPYMKPNVVVSIDRWRWPTLTVAQVFILMILIFAVNLGYLDHQNQVLCDSAAARVAVDEDYNNTLMQSEEVLLKEVVGHDRKANAERYARTLRIATYRKRAEQSRLLQICTPHAYGSSVL